ncbi:unnamed protein product [Mytilus coruscus]|uniref:Uncharacterized protein n=1 Tax=Mytilus coruscus TaxID=42192 RepID=A0A6J8C6I4_MYTCO|nr:unnamed protein product [Mytilus coruscus]
MPFQRQPAIQGPAAPALNVQAPFAQVETPAPVPMPNQNGEINNDPLLIPNQSECDVYVSQNLKEKYEIENLLICHYFSIKILSVILTDLQNVISYDNTAGSFVITSNKNSKIKSIQNIESWTDAFIIYMKIFIQRFPNLATYMSIIRGSHVCCEKICRYNQQFRLRMAKNPTRSWSSIDGILWYTVIANGEPECNTIQQTSVGNRLCYDYNSKEVCYRQNCFCIHSCLKCGFAHYFVFCPQQVNSNQTYPRVQNAARGTYQNTSRPARNFAPRTQTHIQRAASSNQGFRPRRSRCPALRMAAPQNLTIKFYIFQNL